MKPIKINPANKGMLHENLGIPQGTRLTTAQLVSAKGSKSKAIRKRANFALNASKWKH